MNFIPNAWGMAVASSGEGAWAKVTSYLPNIFGAVIVFVVGVFLSISLGILVAKILHKMKIDRAAEEIGLAHLLEQGGVKARISFLIGEMVKWFLFIVFLMAAADILHLEAVSLFLNSVLLYIPNVIVAAIILAISILIANFISKVIARSGEATKISHYHILGILGKWAILIFGVMAALVQLGVATSLLTILFAGLVAMLSLAGGLAFGLGGREKAAQLLDEWFKK